MPPCAATYGSCLPHGSSRMSISISHAASASAPWVIEVRRACASPLSSATVNAPDEPIPVPAGTSATEAISSGFPRQWRSERLAQDRMPDLGDLVDVLGLRVLHLVAALEDRVHQHVDVLVDRAGDEEAAVLAVVGGQIGAAAAERDPQRRPAEDDAHRRPGLGGRPRAPRRTDWRRTTRACGRSPARIVSVGAQPERADPRAVEVDQRAVAGPAAPAAGVLELAARRPCARRSRRSSRRRRRSRRCPRL